MSLELKDVVSISGKPGLYKIVGQRPNGLIVESIDEKKKRFPTSITQKVSILEDISMYTTEGDVKLAEVLVSLNKEAEGGLVLVSKKSSGDEIREFFRKILPTFDENQVYNSDILKLVSWYEILKDHLDFKTLLEKKDDDASEDSKSSADTTSADKKPKAKKAKSAAPKKTSVKSAPAAKPPKLTQRKMS